MTLSEFINALKTMVHERSYRTNEVEITSLYTIDDDTHEVRLSDSNCEETVLIISKYDI